MKRLFVGIPLPNDIKEALQPILKAIRETGGDFTFVSLSNLHITVKFLGDVREEDIPTISEKLKGVAQRHHPYPARCRGLGAFPRPLRPSVLWTGIECPQLLLLLKDVHLTLDYLHHEEREDVPHVTLARVKSGRKLGKLPHLVQEFRGKDFGEMIIDKLVLYESELRPANEGGLRPLRAVRDIRTEGPRYRVVKEFGLN